MSNSNTANIQKQNPKEFNLQKRIFNFVVRILNLTKALPKTAQNLVLINQITRSVTSVGANAQEADGSGTRKEFFRCFIIAKKEVKETNYWLDLIAETNTAFKSRMIEILKEGQEIEAIISSIVKKSKS